jgi:hypothetical protein
MKEIAIEIKSVYGNETIYPVDENAKLFARLAGTKTLTRQAISHIKALGYEVKVKQPEL